MSVAVRPPRALNSDEVRVLNALLSLDFPGAEEVRRQIPHVRVVGRCDCGCATVDLQIEAGKVEPAAIAGRPIQPEATVLDADGNRIGGVIVFLKDGYLTMLEIYMFGNEPIREWPPSEHLRLELGDR